MADMILPPGLTMAAFKKAQKAFEAAVGAENVFFTALDRHTYEDKFAIDPTHHIPLGGIAPSSAEEVQAIVRIAAENKVPLWPISRGKNSATASAPELSGTVVLDMSRMKHIELDVEKGTVLLEPGVGFYDLYDYLTANNLPFWLSVPGTVGVRSRAMRSIAASATRPMARTRRRSAAWKWCCPMAIWSAPAWARAKAPTWQLYRYGFGPAWDQLFVQSNFGIVTKVGMWLMPEPES